MCCSMEDKDLQQRTKQPEGPYRLALAVPVGEVL